VRSRSDEETRVARIEAMGDRLGVVYDALYNDVLWLQTKWSQLRALFLTSPERTRALFEVAEFFFLVIRGTLWEDCLLHIARLTDKATQGDYENLSILCLPALVENPTLRSMVQSRVDRAVHDAYFARTYRDKYLAHADLGFALETVESLPPVEVENVERVLADLRSVVNSLQEHYFGEPIQIQDVATFGDAETLVTRLLGDGSPRA